MNTQIVHAFPTEDEALISDLPRTMSAADLSSLRPAHLPDDAVSVVARRVRKVLPDKESQPLVR